MKPSKRKAQPRDGKREEKREGGGREREREQYQLSPWIEPCPQNFPI